MVRLTFSHLFKEQGGIPTKKIKDIPEYENNKNLFGGILE